MKRLKKAQFRGAFPGMLKLARFTRRSKFVQLMQVLLAALVLVFSLAGAGANAQTCRATTPSGNYGNVNILSGAPASTTANFSVTCTGRRNAKVRLCLDLSIGTSVNNALVTRALASGANDMVHEIYADPAHSQIWGAWSDNAGFYPYGSGGIQRDVTISANGAVVQPFTLYGQIAGSQTTLPPGTYVWQSTSPGLTYYNANATSPSCPSGTLFYQGPSGADTWTATILPNCLLSATDVNFGAVGSLTPGVAATGMISATCTNSTAFTLSLSNGLGPGATGPTSRQMTLGVNAITYGLYQDSAHSLPFGSTTGVDTASGTGNGLVQSFPVYGFVPSQPTPTVGSYADTIVVTLTY